MHPTESAGDQAGQAATSWARPRTHDDVLILASASASGWLLSNPQFKDRTGTSRAAYVRAYLAAYRHPRSEA